MTTGKAEQQSSLIEAPLGYTVVGDCRYTNASAVMIFAVPIGRKNPNPKPAIPHAGRLSAPQPSCSTATALPPEARKIFVGLRSISLLLFHVV